MNLGRNTNIGVLTFIGMIVFAIITLVREEEEKIPSLVFEEGSLRGDGNGVTYLTVTNRATNASAYIKRVSCIVHREKDLKVIRRIIPQGSRWPVGSKTTRDPVAFGTGTWDGERYVFSMPDDWTIEPTKQNTFLLSIDKQAWDDTMFYGDIVIHYNGEKPFVKRNVPIGWWSKFP